MRRAEAEGEGGPAAVRALSGHAARLRRIIGLAAGGAGLTEAAKAAGVFWRNEKEMLRQARAWTLGDLDELAPQLLDADRAVQADRLARPPDRRAPGHDHRRPRAAAWD